MPNSKTIRAADGGYLLDATNGKPRGVVDGQLAWGQQGLTKIFERI